MNGVTIVHVHQYMSPRDIFLFLVSVTLLNKPVNKVNPFLSFISSAEIQRLRFGLLIITSD